MVCDAVEFTGGLSDIIEDGRFVVIKPNLVSTRTSLGTFGALSLFFTDPYKDSSQVPQMVNGLTVDWRVTKAMVELVRELNPSARSASWYRAGRVTALAVQYWFSTTICLGRTTVNVLPSPCMLSTRSSP